MSNTLRDEKVTRNRYRVDLNVVLDSGILAIVLQTCVSHLKFSLKIMVNKMYRFSCHVFSSFTY